MNLSMLSSPNSLSMFHAKDQERKKRIKRQKSRFFNLNYLNIKCFDVTLFRNRYRRSRFGSILSPAIAFLKQNLYRYRYRFAKKPFPSSRLPRFLNGIYRFLAYKKIPDCSRIFPSVHCLFIRFEFHHQ